MRRTARSVVLAAAVLLVGAAVLQAGPAADEAAAVREDAMQAVHAQLSASCFNDCRALIDKRGRTDEDTENMLLLANASLWHWKQRADCQPVNLSVGYWLLSRVHALAGQADMAVFFGGRCLAVSEQNQLPPFYTGCAYEALARAVALRGDIESARGLVALARAKQSEVTDMEQSTLLATDLREIEQGILPKQ